MPQAATMKKPSSSAIFNRMRSEASTLKIKNRTKTERYRGYSIVIYEELVEGAGHCCCIKNITGNLAERRGLDQAKKYIDRLVDGPPRFKIKRTRPKEEVTADCGTHKLRVKIKRNKEKKWH